MIFCNKIHRVKEICIFLTVEESCELCCFYILRGILLNSPCYMPRCVLYSLWKGEVIIISISILCYSILLYTCHPCASDIYDMTINICVTGLQYPNHLTGCSTVYLCDSTFLFCIVHKYRWPDRSFIVVLCLCLFCISWSAPLFSFARYTSFFHYKGYLGVSRKGEC
jgi:hypothetical protein